MNFKLANHRPLNLSVKRFVHSPKNEQEPRAGLLGLTQLVPVEDRIQSPTRCVLNRIDNVQNCDSYIYHRHKPIDSINLLGS
jgi:hypothetical protein